MSRFVEVPRETIITALEKAGFKRVPGGGEVTYERTHNLDPRLTVRVYTSVPERFDQTRACGEDAIRIVAAFSWQRQGEDVPRRKHLYSKRVYRVTSPQSVVDRMMERAREAYQACNEFRKNDGARRPRT